MEKSLGERLRAETAAGRQPQVIPAETLVDEVPLPPWLELASQCVFNTIKRECEAVAKEGCNRFEYSHPEEVGPDNMWRIREIFFATQEKLEIAGVFVGSYEFSEGYAVVRGDASSGMWLTTYTHNRGHAVMTMSWGNEVTEESRAQQIASLNSFRRARQVNGGYIFRQQ